MTRREPPCEDHNGPQWLAVRFLAEGRRARSKSRGFYWQQPGWYVVRTCPCHPNYPVTLPLDSEAAAERTRRVMLELT